MPLLAYPSDDVIWDATLSMTNEDSEFPVENAQNNDPSWTAKATTTSTVVTVTLLGNVTPVAAAVINTNATAWAVSNDAGLNQSATIPSVGADGQLTNAWVDLTGLSNRLDDRFYFTLSKTGSQVLEVGRLCLLVETQAPHLVIAGAGSSPVFSVVRPGMKENRTRLGSSPRRASPTRFRRVKAQSIEAEFLAVWQQLEAESNGLNRGFFFVPDDDVNDAWFAQIEMGDLQWNVDIPDNVIPVSITIEEISMGLPPDVA